MKTLYYLSYYILLSCCPIMIQADELNTVLLQTNVETDLLKSTQWEIFTNRSQIYGLSFSEDGNTLWVETSGGIEKRDAWTGEIQYLFFDRNKMPNPNATNPYKQGKIWIGKWNDSLLRLPESYLDVLLDSEHDDSQGGIWTGTYDGLYYKKPGNNRRFTSPLVALDEYGGLWLGTYGLGIIHYTTQGKWQILNEKNSHLPSNYIRSIFPDGQGGLWIGTVVGLAHYTAAGQWETFNTENSNLPSNNIALINVVSQDELWIGASNQLLHYKAEQWQVFKPVEMGLTERSHISSILPDKQGGIWVGTTDGLVRYTNGQWQKFDDNWNLPFKDAITTLLSDEQSGLWIGTIGSGLVHYSQGQWQIFNQENSALPNNFVSDIISDKQNGLWIIVDNNLVNYNQGQWQIIPKTEWGVPSDDENTRYTEMQGPFLDNKGGLWFGILVEGGNYIKDYVAFYKQGQRHILDPNISDIPLYQVRSIISDDDGGIWIGAASGLLHYTQHKTWQLFNESNSGLPGNAVNKLLSDNQGGLWIAMLGPMSSGFGDEEANKKGGIVHYTAQGQWEVFNSENSALPSNDVFTVVADEQAGLWIGTTKGLAYYYQGKWQIFDLDNVGFPLNKVFSLVNDASGSLWIATYNGLIHLNYSLQ